MHPGAFDLGRAHRQDASLPSSLDGGSFRGNWGTIWMLQRGQLHGALTLIGNFLPNRAC